MFIQGKGHSVSDGVATLAVAELTHDTAVQHPGSHQHEGEQKEDEVAMVPRTWGKENNQINLKDAKNYKRW